MFTHIFLFETVISPQGASGEDMNGVTESVVKCLF